MATYDELKALAIEADRRGDRETAVAAMKKMKELESSSQPIGGPVMGAAETAAMMATGILAEPVSGLAGIAGTLLPGESGQGARWVEGTRNAMTYQPRTQTGQRYSENLADAAAYVDELPRGLTGESFSEATGNVTSMLRERGADLLSPFGEKGSATGAAIGEALIPAVGAVAGLRGGGKIVPRRGPKPERIDPRVEPLRDRTGDVETAKVKLDAKGNVVKDKAAVETIRQGFDEGFVASIKASGLKDRRNMLSMVDEVEKGLRNKRYAALHRPSDVVGNSLSERVSHIRTVNQDAGKKLDKVANNLKGQPVDYSPAVDGFLSSLDDLGIKFNNGKLDFSGSDIEGLAGPQRIFSNVVNRMLNTRVPDAYDVHRLKRFLDEQVTYGKTQRGLSGKASVVLKDLRHNLDAALDNQFPEYNLVNTQYAETISALDDFQSAVGKRIDLTGPNVDKALGVASRKILTNYASRTELLDALNSLDAVANKYGGAFSDDIIVQAMFVDELNGMFGDAAKGSFGGKIEQAVKTASREGAAAAGKEYVIDQIAKKANDLRGVNKQAAINALRKLLSEQPQLPESKPGLPVPRQ